MGEKRIAVYPGTFDPFTNGHQCIVQRGMELFDGIIVAVAEDCSKKTLFSLEERVDIVREIFTGIPEVRALPFSGLLVNFAAGHNAKAILRGLRAVSDFDYEFQMALVNRQLNPAVQTIFLMSDLRWMYISSTNVRNVASLGGDVSSLVPPQVLRRLRDAYHLPADWPHPASAQ
ncbi:pantetheine-phosphate adenylyltransferase [uncultured Mailhella sp.]|uniref:pantetheine-phosphate adenylyltransferase n=1 Tax=uncultured Mailhella sp. TaxID=1981031 RepID=UPI0026332C3E|nr:pantetheine-phosphate adenylyltransferase [uncultured Mailhella sp.]